METEKRYNNYLRFSALKQKIKSLANPGIILMAVAVITLIIANSPAGDWYRSLWNVQILLGTEHFNFLNHHGQSLTTLQLVNDAIMAIFFFTVGIEIKREILTGELSSFRKAILPIIAAFGGMIFPVLFFYVSGKLQGFDAAQLEGMAIPMATDIAFSIGVLTMLGNRIPIGLKVFLLALAIVDDIGGIIVIAVFYSEMTLASLVYLGIAALLFGILLLGNKMEVHSKAFYITFGIIIWYLFLQAGIHPTISGVIVALTVPARPHLNLRDYTEAIKNDLQQLKSGMPEKCECLELSNEQMQTIRSIANKTLNATSPLHDFEDNLHNWVSYFIMPLFAFANAGVVFNISQMNIFDGISLSIILGLVFGKVTGILTFTWLSVKTGISSLPNQVGWRSLTGVSLLAGIGFTVALFLASLSYPAGSEMLNEAKMGIIFASLIAGISGFYVLKQV